ncbi:S-layer family protein [Alkalinema sp. FACHB-956]|uniref:two-partner secretion domain-containing protein n=1 Tax=Alkalinema sp. FACHB-956 TaxID=2692768 RepID=UPI001683032A|nr:S-layer family protein [Alkalinema sp. FACHB-956]MBD2328076.1 S-layer family protein [Alkalinema sp. FACHB-956]
MNVRSFISVFSCLVGLLSSLELAQAQVIPDGTLPTTVTSSNARDFTIDNGARSGGNLFHSFSQFSVPTGGSAVFNNALDVQNIFARVTGGTASNIDGLIKANGAASLFLLNPSGILFGSNASLNIGGSFVGTTATSIQFADGTVFSAANSGAPLLTMSAPVGLQMGANAGPIQVQGPGTANPFFRPPTLSVVPTKTLALVAGLIDVNSATLSAPDGRVELWAVQNGQITMNSQPWQLASSAATANWGNITLQQASTVDASGLNGGAINIRGRGLTVQEGSNISSITFAGQGKGITVQTTEFVDLLGASLPGQIGPGISTNVGILFGPSGSGQAGNVTVETVRLRLADGAWLQSSSAGNNSRSGDVTVRAKDVEVVGANPFFPAPTSITTNLFSGKNNESGKISIDADRIRVVDGGIVSSALVAFDPISAPTGKAGDISIRASESLEISGYTPNYLLSGIATGIGPTEGQAGNITIDVGHLHLSNGGTIRSTLTGSGQAGNITIHAMDVSVSDPVVDVIEQAPGGITVAVNANAVGSGGKITLTSNSLRLFNGGQIASSTQGQGSAGNINLNVKTLDIQGISQTLVNGQHLPSAITASSSTSFDAGSINITADTVQVRDAGQITVSNTGTGNAGNLNVNAKNIFLDNGASLRAEVNDGSQGNINLTTKEVLLLRRASHITTNAQGASTGGNINIRALAIVGLENENSDIVANAVLGSGGNINITTQALLGLQFRPKLTPKSDITASSEFGLNGNVQVNTIGTDPNAGLTELPVNVADPSQKIATGCAANQGSQFVATGRGGVPQNPNQQVMSDRTWNDLRDLSAYRGQSSTVAASPAAPSTLVQASGFQRNADGTIALIASPTTVSATSIATCSG